MSATLIASGLVRSFGGVRAVDGVSLTVAPGEMLAMIGPNGAGKSTCFNIIGGQLRPDAGCVQLNGVDITGQPPQRLRALGVGRTFQITATFASMTVCENVQTALLAHHGQVWSIARRARLQHRAAAEALLEQVGMLALAGRPAGELAYGDLKRLELAMALVGAPRLLLMDEPTAGMAPAERAGLMALTRRLATAQGIAVLFTEHDMDVVFGHADRIVVLARGSVIAEGDAASVRANARVREVYLGGEA